MITYRIIGQEQRDNETGNSYRLSAYVVAPTRGRARTLFVQYFDNQLEYKYEGIASCKVEKKGVRGPERVIESHYLAIVVNCAPENINQRKDNLCEP